MKLFRYCHIVIVIGFRPSSFTPVFQQSDYQMADHPSHTLLFVPSDVRDSMSQSDDKPPISPVGLSCNSDGGCNSIAF